MTSLAAARAVIRGGQQILPNGKTSACLYIGAGSARTRRAKKVLLTVMSVRILASVRSAVVSAVQRLPSVPASDIMSVSIRGSDLMPVISATYDLLNKLISYTTSVLTLAKGLLSVLYAAADLARVALATFIRHAVGARGSGSMRNA